MELKLFETPEIKQFLIPNKINAKTIAISLKDKIKNGELCPLECYAFLKFLCVIEEEFKDKEMISTIRDEIAKHGKTAEINGHKFTPNEGRKTYDFSHDPLWQKLNKKAEHYKKLLKEREELLKKVPTPDHMKKRYAQQVLDEDSGELYDLLPPVTTGGNAGFAVTLS